MRSGFIVYIYMDIYGYIIYTPNLGLVIAISGWEREQSRFRGSSEGARGSKREYRGSIEEQRGSGSSYYEECSTEEPELAARGGITYHRVGGANTNQGRCCAMLAL